jgi:hypothetical protein
MTTSAPAKLFLDTNVCYKLLASPYLAHLSGIRAAICKRYRIVVSPETMIELMRTFKGGSGEFFHEDRKRLGVMAGWTEYPVFLSLPGEFGIKASLGLNAPARFGRDEFRRIYKLFLAATSRHRLFETGVPKGNRIVKFDPGIIERQHLAGRASHRSWLKDVLSGEYKYPPPDRWAVAFAKVHKLDLSVEQADTLATDLSAFEKTLFEAAAKNSNYQPDGHDGDWVDGQQLIYLCDPNIHFLTDDKSIKAKCAKSQQCHRVLLLPEFVRSLGHQI